MEKTKQQKVKDFLINNGVIIVMFILVIYTGFTSNNFFTVQQLNEYSYEYEFTVLSLHLVLQAVLSPQAVTFPQDV